MKISSVEIINPVFQIDIDSGKFKISYTTSTGIPEEIFIDFVNLNKITTVNLSSKFKKTAKQKNITEFDNLLTTLPNLIQETYDKIKAKQTQQTQQNQNNQQTYSGKNIPTGFNVTQFGIFALGTNNSEEFISSPFEITKKFEDLDTQEVSYEITFNGNTYNNKVILSGSEIASVEGIKKLAGYGILTSTATSSSLLKYMALYRNINTIPSNRIYSSMGWKNNFSSFVVGNKEYSLETILGFPDVFKEVDVEMYSIDKKYIDALHQKGTLKDWMKNSSLLLADNKARFALYGSCSAPILAMVDGDSKILDSYAVTSEGKSIKNRLAMSVWGNPIDLEINADNTNFFFEKILSVFNNIPINIDETQVIKEEDLNQLIYKIGNENGRGRGRKDLTIREIKTWKTIVLASGEKPLTGEDSLGGASVRGISIHGGLSKNEIGVKQYISHETENYGLIAPLFIKKLMEIGVFEIKNRYNKCKEKISSAHGLINNNVASRMTDTFAIVLLAGELFEEIMKENKCETKDPLSVVSNIAIEIIKETASTAFYERALQHLYGWIATNESKFKHKGLWLTSGNSIPSTVYGNYIDSEHFEIFINVLSKAFDKTKFSIDSVKADWIKQGIINKSDKTSTIGKINGKVYVFNPTLIKLKYGLTLPDEDNEAAKSKVSPLL